MSRQNIGILTHCIADNYGANLQALSTACYLRNHGYNPVFYRWDPYPVNINLDQVKLHQTFLERQGFEVSTPCENEEDFIEVTRRYSIQFIIVGSDCVFTYKKYLLPFTLTRKGIKAHFILPDWQFPNPFWLPFLSKLPNVKAVIMSGSCGCSDLIHSNKKVSRLMYSYLSKFSYISVRDNYTKKSLEHIMGKSNVISLPITPDPVFGFNENIHSSVTKEDILNKFGLPENYIVSTYYESGKPSIKWLSKLKHLINQRGYTLVNLTMPQGGKSYPYDRNIELPLDTMDWYYLIKYSKGFIGNNMHPIIVSIYNCVPFFSINDHGKYYLRGRIQFTRKTKEYELLRSLDMLEYHIGIKQIWMISPEEVVSKIFNFSYHKSLLASKSMATKYNVMMEEILNLV